MDHAYYIFLYLSSFGTVLLPTQVIISQQISTASLTNDKIGPDIPLNSTRDELKLQLNVYSVPV